MLTRLVLVTCFLLAAILVVGTSAKREYKPPRFHLGRPHDGGFRPKIGVKVNLDQLEASTIDQRIDHLGWTNYNGTFKQRYYYNSKYRTLPNAPCFLQIGGEAPEDGGFAAYDALPYIQFASKLGAAVFDLEHRFYGESQPFNDTSTEHLKLLSSRQAIEDIAYFIGQMNARYAFDNPKWIVFGGSYAGALALWARQAHPEVIAGAVGSSGPVQAKLDFYQYLTVVENSIRSNDPNCAEVIHAAMRSAEAMMQTVEGRDTLTHLFGADPPLNSVNLTYDDIYSFYGVLFSDFMEIVQYGGDNAGNYATIYTIPAICGILTNTTIGDELTRLLNMIYFVHGTNATTISNGYLYQDVVDFYKDTSLTSANTVGGRCWLWQTCTEFGYFQSTDGGQTIFDSIGPNSGSINLCIDVFPEANFTADSIAANIQATLDHYGGAEGYNGTNVVIPNGSQDPWHALGKYTSTDPSVVPYLINGTAHCGDMYPVRDGDKNAAGLRVVQQLQFNNIYVWLNGDDAPSSPINVTHKLAETTSRATGFPTPKRFTSKISWPKEKTTNADGNREKFVQKSDFMAPPFLRFRRAAEWQTDVDIAPPSGTITQPVDHFDNTNPNQFTQTFWSNLDFIPASGRAANFLFLGGEGAVSTKWINGNVMYLQWARQVGAAAYALEHRFYGTSPAAINNTVDIRFLSSRQAIADAAQFAKSINAETKTNKPWIVFGGSYSGALAAWTRQWFPDVFAGAVASSAPVEATLDFYQYLSVVETSFRTYSPSCTQKIADGFTQIARLYQTKEGRAQLTQAFQFTNAFNEPPTLLDQQNFFSWLYGNFQGAVQYSGDNAGLYATGYGIPDACALIQNATDPLAGIVAVNAYMSSMGDGNYTGADLSYNATIQYLQDTSFNNDDRQWTYQTCTEFGYFQSTDTGKSIFGQPTPLNYFVNMCTDAFGANFTTQSVDAAVQETLRFYGGARGFKGTNVVLPNGSLDPWHALGKLTSNDSSVVPILITGTAHCADMYPARDSDVQGVKDARVQIFQLIQQWIGGAQNPLTSTQSPSNATTPETSTKAAPRTLESMALLIFTLLITWI